MYMWCLNVDKGYLMLLIHTCYLVMNNSNKLSSLKLHITNYLAVILWWHDCYCFRETQKPNSELRVAQVKTTLSGQDGAQRLGVWFPWNTEIKL